MIEVTSPTFAPPWRGAVGSGCRVVWFGSRGPRPPACHTLVAENAEKLPPVFVHKVTLEPAFSGCVELFIPANLGLSLQPEFDVATSGAAVLLP